MDNFSMKLDLSNFFKDERRQSLVFIDANWQNIKDVQDHIQNLFKLKDINLLTTDGCFLPPREAIQVLKGAQGLKAFRFNAPEQNDFASPAPVTKPSKKRKYTSAEEEVELPSSTPNRPSKRSKKKSSIVPEILAVTSPDLSTEPFGSPLKSSQNSTKYDKLYEEPSAASVPDRRSSKSSRTLRNKSLVEAAVDQETLEEEPAPQNEILARQPIVAEISAVTSPDLSIGPFGSPLKSSQNSTKYDKLYGEPSAASVPDRSSSKSSRTLRKKSLVEAVVDQQTLEEEPAPQNEILARQPIVFRCPLMELDSNTQRTFELPAKKNDIVIIENITIKPANGIRLEPGATDKPDEAAADVIEAESLLADEEASEILNAEPNENSVHQQDKEPEETADLTNATEGETSQIEEKIEPQDILESPATALPPVRICAESLSSESDDDDVMVLDDTNADDSDSDVQAVAPTEEPKQKRSLDIIQDMMGRSIALDGLPNRGDSIIFKLLKVKGNPSFGVTDFIAGNCTYVNRRTKVITLEVISFPSEFKRILRQYTSILDDSGDDIGCLNVNFKDLRDTKIVVDAID